MESGKQSGGFVGDARKREDEAAFHESVGAHGPMLARYIRHRIVNPSDAEDVLQETLVAAWRGFRQLRESPRMQAWLLQIARNRRRDYFRAHDRRETPLEAEALEAYATRFGLRQYHQSEQFSPVLDALEAAPTFAREAIQQFYGEGWTIAEIAATNNRPTGTIKRQLFQARHALRNALGISLPNPQPPPKEKTMPAQKPVETLSPAFPAVLPRIQITEIDEPPFAVDCRELRTWAIIPALGEEAFTADYGLPGWTLSEVTAMRAMRAAEVHGVEGVEIEVRQWKPEVGWQSRLGTIIARLTEHKAEFLAVHLPHEDATQFETFLDENFAWNWGTVERALADEGWVRGDSEGALLVADDAADMPRSDIGRGLVQLEIGDKSLYCLRVLDVRDTDTLSRGEGYLTVSYVTEAGQTVLVRRYCPPRFAEAAQFPVLLDPGDTLTINGVICLRWYDTLTSVALPDSPP